MQQVTPAAGLVPPLGTKVSRQHQPAFTLVYVIKHPAE